MTDPVASAPLLDPSAAPIPAPTLTSQDMMPELISRAAISTSPAVVELVTETTTWTPAMVHLMITKKARIRWYVTTPGGVMGTLFGRVIPTPGRKVEGLIYVAEENTGKIWALNPDTDHLAVLSQL